MTYYLRLLVMVLSFAAIGSASAGGEVIRKTSLAVPDNGDWSGRSGTLSLTDPIVACPVGSFVAAIQGFRATHDDHAQDDYDDHGKGIIGLRYMCRDAAGNLVGIGRTDQGIPATGSMSGGYSGTLDLAAADVFCPLGTFVSDLQLGGPTGANYYVFWNEVVSYSCRNSDGWTELRATTSGTPLQFGNGWSATAFPDNPLTPFVRCPDRYYVVGIQGFKGKEIRGDDLHVSRQEAILSTPILQLRYLCRPLDGV